MVRRFLPLAVLLLIPSSSAAPDVLIISKAGYWLLSEDAAGVPVLKKLPVDSVIRWAGAPDDPVDPVDPVDPGPGQLTEFEKKVLAKASTIDDPANWLRLALAYVTVGDQVASGAVDFDNAFLALSKVVDNTLLLLGGGDAALARFAEFRKWLGEEFDILRGAGKLGTAEQFGAVMKSVGKALRAASAPGSDNAAATVQRVRTAEGLFDNIDLAKLIEFFLQLLKLFGFLS